MIWQHDLLICPECGTSFKDHSKDALPRYIEDWCKNADEVTYLLRPELTRDELPTYRTYVLYQDCYFNLLIGRYNAAIVLMGVLIEALIKDRILLKLGEEFRGELGSSIKKIEECSLMEPRHIRWLREFKNQVRNPYSHSNEREILNNRWVYVWPIHFTGELDEEKLRNLHKIMDRIKSNELKPVMLPAGRPEIRSLVKPAYDKKHAIRLFNDIVDFLVEAKIKYFKKEEWEDYHKKFSKGYSPPNSYRI